MHLIDYAHRRAGVLYHGTLSDLDGEPKATWTYEKGGRKVTQDQPLAADTFRSLWNRVGNLDVFKRNRVRDPSQPVDPDATHVVGIAFGDPKSPQLAQFAVPAGEADPQFRRWLKSLNIPSAGGGPPPLPAAERAKARARKAAAREEVYPQFFGSRWIVHRDADPDGPPIDVYAFAPGRDGRGDKRDFYTLVTGGLSDARMPVPDGARFHRAELVLYVPKPTDQHVELLRFLARLPLVQATTWYGYGTTMTNGDPPQPVFPGSALDCFLFHRSPVGRDEALSGQLAIDGDPVRLLWVVPLTRAECRYIGDRTLEDFLGVLERKGAPFLLDEGRRSYVGTR